MAMQPSALARFDVLQLGHHAVLVRMRGDGGAKAGDDRHHLRQGVHVHADIDRHVVHARGVQAVDRCKVGLRVQWQAGVGFPVNHGVFLKWMGCRMVVGAFGAMRWQPAAHGADGGAASVGHGFPAEPGRSTHQVARVFLVHLVRRKIG